jgi:hypothetical protein
MENAQVHAAVGAQVASQSITIPPPLFRSFQGAVAAHLLPKRRARSSSGWRSPARSLRRSADGRTWQEEPSPRRAKRSEVGLLGEMPPTPPRWSFPWWQGAPAALDYA